MYLNIIYFKHTHTNRQGLIYLIVKGSERESENHKLGFLFIRFVYFWLSHIYFNQIILIKKRLNFDLKRSFFYYLFFVFKCF
jgi:hypothetical protein